MYHMFKWTNDQYEIVLPPLLDRPFRRTRSLIGIPSLMDRFESFKASGYIYGYLTVTWSGELSVCKGSFCLSNQLGWWNLQGLFAGLICGLSVQTLILVYITVRTDWNKQVFKINVHNCILELSHAVYVIAQCTEGHGILVQVDSNVRSFPYQLYTSHVLNEPIWVDSGWAGRCLLSYISSCEESQLLEHWLCQPCGGFANTGGVSYISSRGWWNFTYKGMFCTNHIKADSVVYSLSWIVKIEYEIVHDYATERKSHGAG